MREWPWWAWALIVAWILNLAYCLFSCTKNPVLERRAAVYRFREDLRRQIFELIKSDVRAGKPHEWRSEVYSQVSEQEMVSSKKPLKPESFWDDTSFLEPSDDTPPAASEAQVHRKDDD